MAETYFSFLQPLMYRGKAAPNIVSRIQLPKSVLDNRKLFHKYMIEDGDRPDTVAFYYYGSSYYDWIVMLSNNFTDPLNDWPLTANQFEAHLEKKYGSVEFTYNNVEYYQINRQLQPLSEVAFNALPASLKKYWTTILTRSGQTLYDITTDDLRLAPSSYNALDEDERVYWESVNTYDKEYQINENKRSIFLIDSQYVSTLEKSLRTASDV